MEYCEACGRDVPEVRQWVPGDRNAAFVCRECGEYWLATHVWDDGEGTWVEVPA